MDINTLSLGQNVVLTFGSFAGQTVSIEAIHYADNAIDVWHADTDTLLDHVSLRGITV